MDWSSKSQGRLTVKQSGAENTFSFEGVNTEASAGSPEVFLDAANHMLNIAGLSAVIDGISRTVKQEAVNNGG